MTDPSVCTPGLVVQEVVPEPHRYYPGVWMDEARVRVGCRGLWCHGSPGLGQETSGQEAVHEGNTLQSVKCRRTLTEGTFPRGCRGVDSRNPALLLGRECTSCSLLGLSSESESLPTSRGPRRGPRSDLGTRPLRLVVLEPQVVYSTIEEG